MRKTYWVRFKTNYKNNLRKSDINITTTTASSKNEAYSNIYYRYAFNISRYKSVEFLSAGVLPDAYFDIEQVREGEKTVTVDGEQRRVSVEKGHKLIEGKVGDTTYRWGVGYKYPLVLRGDESREVIKKYVETYITSPMKSPIHVESYNGEGGDTSSRRGGVDYGLPEWLTRLKEWTECYHRKGPLAGTLKYLRRTLFKEEFIPVGKIAAPVCSNCNQRFECQNPCQVIEGKLGDELLNKVLKFLRAEEVA